jgi:hypothetical protein
MDSGSEVRPSKLTRTSVFRLEAATALKAGIFSVDINEHASNYRFNIVLRHEVFRRLPNIDMLQPELGLQAFDRTSAALAIYQEALQRAHRLILQDPPEESIPGLRSTSSCSKELSPDSLSIEELSEKELFGEGALRLCASDEAYSRLFLSSVSKFSDDQLQRLAKRLNPWLSTFATLEHCAPVVIFAIDRVPEARQACEDLCLRLIYKDGLAKAAKQILSRLLQSQSYSFKVLKLAISRLSQCKLSSQELISVVTDATQNLGDQISFELIYPLLYNILARPVDIEGIQLLNLVVDRVAAADLGPIGDRLTPNISSLIDHPVGYQTVLKLIRSKHQGTLSAFEFLCKESPVHLFVKKTRKIVFHAYLSLEESQRQITTLTGVFFAVRRTRSDLRYLLKKEISVCLLLALLCKLGSRIEAHFADLRLRVESICQADPEISTNTFSSQLLSCLSKLGTQSRIPNYQVTAPNATEHQVQTHH